MLPQTKVGYKHMSMTLLKKKKKRHLFPIVLPFSHLACWAPILNASQEWNVKLKTEKIPFREVIVSQQKKLLKKENVFKK